MRNLEGDAELDSGLILIPILVRSRSVLAFAGMAIGCSGANRSKSWNSPFRRLMAPQIELKVIGMPLSNFGVQRQLPC
jgi:hypothetical protein